MKQPLISLKSIMYLFMSALFMWFATSCKEDDPGVEPEPEPLQILSFKITNLDPQLEGIIDHDEKTVDFLVGAEVNVKSLTIEAEVSEGAVLSPESGYSYNFTEPVVFKVTKGTQSVNYTVSVQLTPVLTSFEVPQYHKAGLIEEDVIHIAFNYGTDLTKITPVIRVPAGLTLSPASNTEVDLSNDFVYTVTNVAGASKNYTVKATHLSQETAVRAVWVPDPSHTAVLHNHQNLQDFIKLVDELHLNTIYLAAWVRERTIFKSQVLLDHTNYTTQNQGWLLEGLTYDGPSGDPVRDLIDMAHAKGIKVIFWFEYGFMRSGGANPPADHPILSVNPNWDGINSFGTAANYNGTDYYLNSFDPEVQEFLLSLMEESIDLYPDIDGIQGDDRMPASPRNSGYNPVTAAKYKEEKGIDPPANYDEVNWVRWRLDNLNRFGRTMYDRIKAKRNDLIVCFSPNPYPWSEQNLMQDWPGWIREGIVEIMSVQCYRETPEAYKATAGMAYDYVKANTTKNIFNPGIYLRSTSSWETVFVEQMKYNRELGTNGEAFFYNEGLKNSTNQRVIKSFYTGKAVFPLP